MASLKKLDELDEEMFWTPNVSHSLVTVEDMYVFTLQVPPIVVGRQDQLSMSWPLEPVNNSI